MKITLEIVSQYMYQDHDLLYLDLTQLLPLLCFCFSPKLYGTRYKSGPTYPNPMNSMLDAKPISIKYEGYMP